MKKIESRKQTRYYFNTENVNVTMYCDKAGKSKGIFYSDQVGLWDAFELIGAQSEVRINRFFGSFPPKSPGDPGYDPKYPNEQEDVFDDDRRIKKFKKFFRMSELIKFMKSREWKHVSFTIERKDGVLFHRLVWNELTITMPKAINHADMTLGFLRKLKQQHVFQKLVEHKGLLVTVNRAGKAYYKKIKSFEDYHQPNFFLRFPELKNIYK